MSDRPHRTYWEYLQIPTLLSTQRPVTEHHDEMQFIIVHQVYELWFKLTLHELVHVRDLLLAGHVAELPLVRAHHHLARVNAIWGIMVQQMHVLETMRPVDFLAFRNALTPASGFQSLQLRLIETLAGLTEDQRITYGGQDYRTFAGFPAAMIDQIDEVSRGGSLRELLPAFLAGVELPAGDREILCGRALAHGLRRETRLQQQFRPEDLDREQGFSKEQAQREKERAEREERLRGMLASPGFQAMLAIYTWPERFAGCYQLCEDLIEFEQRFVLWRIHHVRTVERFIGKKIGSGGSTGVPYLENTARYRIFEDLWSVRTLLVHPQEPDEPV